MATTFQRLQVALGVRDVEGAASFYGLLGFEVVAKMGEPPTFALLGRDAVTLSLVQAPAPAVADFAACYIYVDDVDAMRALCANADVPIANELSDHPWGNRDFVIRDPDGHRIAIGQVNPGKSGADGGSPSAKTNESR